jgi:hypothetical protein
MHSRVVSHTNNISFPVQLTPCYWYDNKIEHILCTYAYFRSTASNDHPAVHRHPPTAWKSCKKLQQSDLSRLHKTVRLLLPPLIDLGSQDVAAAKPKHRELRSTVTDVWPPSRPSTALPSLTLTLQCFPHTFYVVDPKYLFHFIKLLAVDC